MNKTFFKGLIKELEENKKFFPQAKMFLNKLNKSKSIRGSSLEFHKQLFLFMSTMRNRELITFSEQEKLRKKVVAFFGLSVGSHAATSWMLVSRADKIKISDPDTLSLSNLNRLKYSFGRLGVKKTILCTEELQRINPYCRVYSTEATGTETVKSVLESIPKPDMLVDEMDDLESKIFLRCMARRMKLPVLMATDVGDNVFLDVERHDLSSKTKFFGGRVKNIEQIDIAGLSPRERISIMFRLVGLDHNSERMLKSLLAIGKTIKTWPQLGATAIVSGGVIATTLKKITLGEKVGSGRYNFLLDEVLVSDYESSNRKKLRKSLVQKILRT